MAAAGLATREWRGVRFKSSVSVTIKADCVYARTQPRDGHLRSPDSLGVDKYLELSFTSTAVEHQHERRSRLGLRGADANEGPGNRNE